MKNALSKIIIIMIISAVFAGIFASPRISPTATRIMREIKFQYKNEKAQMYLSAYLRDKNLTNEQVVQIRERMNFFFDSDTFLETGAAYLTALFNENDLSEILTAVMNGFAFENGSNRSRNQRSAELTRKLQRLFSELDPYLYRYLEQNIIPQPRNQG
jgi:hypothetical protein